MKQIIIFFVFIIFNLFSLSAEEKNYKIKWQEKSYKEKYSYIEGFLDSGLSLGRDIEIQITQQEKLNRISKKTGDYIEIPVIYISFAVGNSFTNGIDSIISYLDDCYNNEIFNNYSVYQLIIAACKSNLIKIDKFQWIFEDIK